MSWDSSKTQIASALNVAGTELFSSVVTLNPGELIHIQVDGDSGGTTDNLVIAVYTTLDPSSEQWDTVAIMSFELDCTDGALNVVAFTLSGLFKFRIGFIRSGSSDTIVTNAHYRKDGVDA